MMMRKSERFEKLGCVSVHIPHLRMHTKINKITIIELFKYALTVYYVPTSRQESIYSILIS